MFGETSIDSRRFGSMKEFGRLNGRRKQVILVGNRPDARSAELFYKTSVKNNWPSQWHSKYRKGYIRFANGEILDLAKQTIDGREVYIFLWSEDIEFLYRRQTSERTILEAFEKLPSQDRKALGNLILETADLGHEPWFCSESDLWVVSQTQIRPYLQILSLRQLEDSAALVAIPARPERSAIPKRSLNEIPSAPDSDEQAGTGSMRGELLAGMSGLPISDAQSPLWACHSVSATTRLSKSGVDSAALFWKAAAFRASAAPTSRGTLSQ